MVFTCTGSTFTDMSLDYSTDGQLIGTITASDTWDEYTKGNLHLNVFGKKYNEKFTLCDDLTSNSVACGYAGAVELNLSGFAASHLGSGFSSLKSTTFITTAYIDFSAKPDGTTTEHCKKNMFASGYDKTSTSTTSTTVSSSQLNATTINHINPAHLFGTIAVLVVVGVGLTVRALRQAKMSIGPVIKMKRLRSRSRSSRSGRSLSSRSRSGSKNHAAEKLIDDKGVMV